MPSSSPRTLVSIATYNESENLAPLVREIQQALPDAEPLVVDDNSPARANAPITRRKTEYSRGARDPGVLGDPGAQIGRAPP